MNRFLSVAALLGAIVVLAGVLFAVFFMPRLSVRAEAFVVVEPVSVVGAGALGSFSDGAVVLARREAFRAIFLQNLAAARTAPMRGGTATSVTLSVAAPGLVRIVALEHSHDAAVTAATVAAETFVQFAKRYYNTQSVYALHVIPGSVVRRASVLSPIVGALISVLVSALMVLATFALVSLVVRTRRTRTSAHTAVITTHASRARLDLQTPYRQQVNPDDGVDDYMRHVYKAYDTSLETLAQRPLEEHDTPAQAAIAPEPQQAATEEERASRTAHDEVSVSSTDSDESAAAPTARSGATIAQNVRRRMRTRPTAGGKALVGARETVGTFLRKRREALRKGIAKKVVRRKKRKGSMRTTTVTGVKTAVAPANLPVAPADALPRALRGNSAHNTTAAAEEPTPEEVRRRLNELLSGKPPRISEE